MDILEHRLQEIASLYSKKMTEQGPMYIFMKECSTGYIHSFNIRALCSMYLLTGEKAYLESVRRWAAFSIRLQGSYGDPAAYNMGYLFEERDKVPVSWFCADTLDQAYALLNVADLLEPSDPLYIKILSSLLLYDDYIQRWNLGENGFAVGYMDGTEPAGSYHTAVTRGICYYASMYRVFSKAVYRDRGLALLHYLLDKLDLNSNYHGSPLHNRCYASDALVCGYYVLAGEADADLKQKIKDKFEHELLPWAVSHQTPDGFWAHDRFGYQPGATPPPVDVSIMGAYSWGMVAGFQVFATELFVDKKDLKQLLEKAFGWLEKNLTPGGKESWGYHGWAMLSILAKYHAETMFPFGDKIFQRKNC